MPRTLLIAAALLASTPVAAQDVPLPAGPFQVVGLSPEMSGAVSLPSVRREGEIGSATLVMLIGPDMVDQMSGIARMDLDYQFRCAAKESRTVAVTAWAVDGSVIARLPEEVAEWEAVNPGSPNEATRAFVCDGASLDGPKVNTVEEFVALNRSTTEGR
ncbi:surface-adhesin E family protein [Brevundimonas sp.]|uniref:surface-adhesin E family protein n=1 Tax=Brevundimonas sp. TaxID=1871086 RepID=UPI002ED9F51B